MKLRPKIDALGLCALAIDAHQKEGTPAHAKAKRLVESAKQIWREQQTGKRCPHCGNKL